MTASARPHPTPPPALLRARGLAKTYGARRVVDDVSLELAPGRVLGLLGPNGAGKSTLVSMLCGLLAPDGGSLLLAGQAVDTRDEAQARRLKARIGLVPQDLALHEDLGARANLALFGALYGLDRATVRRRAEEALQLVGLVDRADDKPATFSGGMKRRLNIACALVHDPDVLLLDEPTVGVDPQSRNAIFDALRLLQQRGKALLYTTHYMEEAERLCDRIVIIDHGRVLAADTLAGLLDRLGERCTLDLGLDATAPGADLPPALADALRGLPGVVAIQPQPDGLQLMLERLDHSAAAISLLAAAGRPIRHLSSRRATLEDVFLALTGRQLRD